MTTEPLRVAVWGFERDELAPWRQQGFEPRRLEGEDRWPEDRPIVVNGRRAAQYLEISEQHLREDGCLPDAILLQPLDEPDPPQFLGDFDAILRSGEWDELRRHLQSPGRFAAAALAEAIPAAFLDMLELPLVPEMITADFIQGAFDTGSATESLDEARRLLAGTEQRSAFVEALGNRLRVHRRVSGPPGAWVEALRQDLIAKRAAATPIQDVAGAIRLTVARLERLQAGAAARAAGGGRWLLESLQQLASDGWLVRDRRPGGQPGYARGGRNAEPIPSPDNDPPPAREFNATVPAEIRRFTVTEEDAGATLAIGDVRGDPINRRLPRFSLELRRGATLLWQGASDQEGIARLPEGAVAEALAAAATDETIVISIVVAAAD